MKPEYRKYLLEYYHDGAWWNLTIPATSEEDVFDRIGQIRNAKLLGTIEMEIPARLGLLAKLLCWLQNRLA